MSTTVFLWTHVQTTLLLLSLFCLLPGSITPIQLARLGIPAIALAMFLPIDLAASIFAHMGLISLSGLALLLDAVLRRMTGIELFVGAQRSLLWTGCALLALLLYPMALGLGGFDPYTLGFSHGPLALLLGLAAALAWGLDRQAIALLLLAALWAWQLEWGESTNLWDYVLDAWTGLAALLWSLTRLPGLITLRMAK